MTALAAVWVSHSDCPMMVETYVCVTLNRNCAEIGIYRHLVHKLSTTASPMDKLRIVVVSKTPIYQGEP